MSCLRTQHCLSHNRVISVSVEKYSLKLENLLQIETNTEKFLKLETNTDVENKYVNCRSSDEQ